AEPLRADPDPALQARLGAGDPRRDPLPGSGLQPVPHLRGAAARGPRGDREGVRAARSDGDEPVPPHRGAASRARARLPARHARLGAAPTPRSMRVLVTGGTGYLGGALVARGCTGVSRSTGVDVRDEESVRAALAGFDAVVHTAYVQVGPDAWPTNVDGSRS